MRQSAVICLAIITVILSSYVITLAQGILTPFMIALVISFLIVALAEGLEHMQINGHTLPHKLRYLIAFLLLFTTVLLLASIFIQNLAAIIQVAPQYQVEVQALFKKVTTAVGIEGHEELLDLIGFDRIKIIPWIASFVGAITDVTTQMGMIAIYVIFILIEYRYLPQKLAALFPTNHHLADAKKVLKKVRKDLLTYVRVKTVISLMTAMISYLIMLLFDLDFALLWSLLIFLFNFIPTFGSIIATVFPSLFALMQFADNPWYALLLAGTLTATQFVVGNVVEPKMMGTSFNISGLVILLALIYCGWVWGVVGMFLSVPIIVILRIICAQFESTRSIAVMISQDGNVN